MPLPASVPAVVPPSPSFKTVMGRFSCPVRRSFRIGEYPLLMFLSSWDASSPAISSSTPLVMLSSIATKYLPLVPTVTLHSEQANSRGGKPVAVDDYGLDTVIAT
jgi:hypothetical protein